MAVAIRLKREGNRNRAFYRIVVADNRSRRDGRFIETLGTYDPLQKGTNYKVDIERADDWITKGAQPSDTVRSILKKARREAASQSPDSEDAPKKETAKKQPEPAAPAKEETPAASAKEETPAASAKEETPAAPVANANENPAPAESEAKSEG